MFSPIQWLRSKLRERRIKRVMVGAWVQGEPIPEGSKIVVGHLPPGRVMGGIALGPEGVQVFEAEFGARAVYEDGR